MPGQKAYPIRLLETDKAKQHLTKAEIEHRRKAEPCVKSNSLRCPGHLGDAERREWRRIVRLYKQIDEHLMCDLDSNLLEQYVVEWVRWRKAQAKIQETSEVVLDRSNGNKAIPNPWLDVERAASGACLRIGSLLMLDIVSRAGAGLAKSKEEDPDTKRMNEIEARTTAKR